ncbi:hypothetical protein [Sutcliffiella horikoshii]|nr:hypothetical protein [Sutcliffiella horikoshii]
MNRNVSMNEIYFITEKLIIMHYYSENVSYWCNAIGEVIKDG